jgi:Spy/CpxP family protein refolding chaperone
MNRKAVFLVIVVFVLGLVLGGLGVYVGAERFGLTYSGRRGPGRTVERLTRELNLTSEQQQKLTAILEDSRARYQAIYEQYRPQMDQVRQDGRQKIRALLTPEQLPKFEAYLQRLDEARKKRNER